MGIKQHIFFIFLSIIIIFIIYKLTIINKTSNKKKNRIIKTVKGIEYQDQIYLIDNKYPGYYNLDLNFTSICNISKYKPNNKRDLLIFSYNFLSTIKEYKMLKNIPILFDGIKNSIPYAKIICLIPEKDINTKVPILLKKYNIELYSFKNYNDWQIVNSRFIISKKYLENNKNKYDRIILSDFGDVFFFYDIFSTFNENEIFCSIQCRDYKTKKSKACKKLHHTKDYKWFDLSFDDKELVKNFTRKNYNSLNNGVIMGGYEKMIKFLEIFCNEINVNKKDIFGFDQSLLNKQYYNNQYSEIDFQVERCTQRLCFKPLLSFINDTEKNCQWIKYQIDSCSPYLIHKGEPKYWCNTKKLFKKNITLNNFYNIFNNFEDKEFTYFKFQIPIYKMNENSEEIFLNIDFNYSCINVINQFYIYKKNVILNNFCFTDQMLIIKYSLKLDLTHEIELKQPFYQFLNSNSYFILFKKEKNNLN